MNRLIQIVLCLLVLNHFAFAQMIELDKGAIIGGLWCFPVYGDSLNYKYLPSSEGGRVVMSENGLPQFSFLRYIIEDPNKRTGNNTVGQADGGGIVTFLVEYVTTDAQVARARAGLKDLFGDEAKLTGPVLVTSAKYTLVSSILLAEGGTKNDVLATGNAPVLENSRLAFSFDLPPERSKLLLESFKMATPDISIIFELGFSGLSDHYEADLHVDWSKVDKSKSFGAGGSIYFIGADVEFGFDELMQESAITLTSVGSNQNMESLLNTVYDRLLSIMFKEVEPSQIPSNERGGLTDALGALIGSQGALGSRNTTGFGLNAHYKMKELSTTGTSDLKFRGRSTLDRYHFVSFNIGDLYRRYGTNQEIFRDVPLYDKAFQQRDVFVGVDGSLESEFDQMVNNVTVKLRKQHTSSEITLKELLVNQTIFNNSSTQLRFTYLNHGDDDLQKWMEYEYQTHWQFVDGGVYQSEWDTANSAVINLFTPFQRKEIVLEGDLNLIADLGIRAIVVRIQYPFFNDVKKESISIRPTDDLSTKYFDVTLPLEQDEINYTITWVKKNGERIEQEGIDDIGILFIDEIPNSE